ncbi:XRE family transcriptional regulator [Nocardia sp. NBC_01503]|uniref:XRE family transcriptional regulator n=1 Tax=Nocardia sp. NBC_01503 TaxID=2975997 RepID=UPI002E7AC451|nr:XRE family transcriptional regulator [Nocardia sp. NBC_01503]WTL34405.1 XRE family transcriptional regulator [Nocardia sp. NBC_01503]
MTTPGNAALRAARQALGYRSQAALAEAVNNAGREIGLRVSVNARTVRRWESADPPWPHPEHATALEALFKQPVTELGFTPPWEETSSAPTRSTGHFATEKRLGQRLVGAVTAPLPASVATDFMTITVSYRHLYWLIPATRLHRSVADHAQLGIELLAQVPEPAKPILARAVAESSLLAGRLEFFDLQQPELSQPSMIVALQAAHEADDPLLGAATLAHMAFAPAFSGDVSRAEEARDHMRAARAFARRGEASAEMVAWLDAVEAEVETRFGDTRRALSLIQHAEETYRDYDSEANPSPAWLDWFSPTRLAGFKGNTLIVAGRGREARETLEQVLVDLPEDAVKQRAVYLADLAAAAVLEQDPERACANLEDALDHLGRTWYATAMDRIKAVRQTLRKWDSLPAVRSLDDRLYDWHTTVNSLVG